MGTAYERIDGYVRPGHCAKAAHLPEVADAELHHGGLGLRADAEERQRHAQLVVEVLLRAQGIVPPCEDAGDHLLGRRLARAAHYADNRRLYLRAAGGSEPRHGLGHVRDDDNGAGDALRHSLRQAAGRARIEGGGDELVSVPPRARQGAEHEPRRDLAVIPHRAGDGALPPAAAERPAGVLSDLRDSHAYHAYFSMEESIILWQSSG